MMANKKPEIIDRVVIRQPARVDFNLDWSQSKALDDRPDPDCWDRAGVLGFLDDVAAFALAILRQYGDYDQAIHEAYGLAYRLGADPAAEQLRRSWPDERLPAEFDIAVTLFSQATAARRCVEDEDAAGAFFHGQVLQRALQAPDTVAVRNKIRGAMPKKPSPAKQAARRLFAQYHQAGKQITWKTLQRDLATAGFTPADASVQGWMTEFRKYFSQ